MTADTVLLVAYYYIVPGIIVMCVKATLINAYLTLYAAIRISNYLEL